MGMVGDKGTGLDDKGTGLLSSSDDNNPVPLSSNPVPLSPTIPNRRTVCEPEDRDKI